MAMIFGKREGEILQRGTVKLSHGSVVAFGFKYRGYTSDRHARIEILELELYLRALDPKTDPTELALLHREYIALRDSL